MPSQSTLKPIAAPRVLLVEGNDEDRFFSSLIEKTDLEDIQIIPTGGVQKFQRRLPILKKTPEYNAVQSVGIVRDADNSFTAAFQSICEILQNNGFSPPSEPINPTGDNP